MRGVFGGVNRRMCGESDRWLPAANLGHDFGGIQDVLGIEDLLDVLHRTQFIIAKHQPHVSALLTSNAVLAGDGAPRGHAQLHHILAGGMNALDHVRVLRIEQDERMQVAVTCMEHVAYLQVMAGAYLVNSC